MLRSKSMTSCIKNSLKRDFRCVIQNNFSIFYDSFLCQQFIFRVFFYVFISSFFFSYLRGRFSLSIYFFKVCFKNVHEDVCVCVSVYLLCDCVTFGLPINKTFHFHFSWVSFGCEDVFVSGCFVVVVFFVRGGTFLQLSYFIQFFCWFASFCYISYVQSFASTTLAVFRLFRRHLQAFRKLVSTYQIVFFFAFVFGFGIKHVSFFVYFAASLHKCRYQCARVLLVCFVSIAAQIPTVLFF